ncbi:MAG: c-type cytochrome [Candidatus Omnitrophica bacterium]|nr:c-type cytochrome [Candidatus Omnitrophota bacterium]
MHPVPFRKVIKMKRLLFGLAVIGLLGAAAPKPTPDPAVGKAAYESNCARCHGPTGAGDGLDAKRMSPMPRKLSEGVFKFRTTGSGTPPTDEDLFRTISTGLAGSRMPDFQRLPEEIRWQLVYYVKSLSTAFNDQKPEPVNLGTDPGPKKATVERGKELYGQLGCAACHGTAGRGDGPSAPTLVDNWGRPIRPADLTHGSAYRGGSSVKDIVARMMTGIDGTPMPSYADALSSPEDAWALATYIRSIQEKPNFQRVIEGVKGPAPLPSGPDDPAWGAAPATTLRLSSNLYREGEIQPTSVAGISVQALYNEKEILFRLAWNDPNESRESPPDAAALALIPDRRLKPKIGSLRSWPATPEAPALDLSLWQAIQAPAYEAVLKDFAQAAGAPEGGAVLESKASYAEGQWILLIKRPLAPAIPGGAALSPSRPTLIGVAVWNGGNGEQGRRRANSNWVDLVLK